VYFNFENALFETRSLHLDSVLAGVEGREVKGASVAGFDSYGDTGRDVRRGNVRTDHDGTLGIPDFPGDASILTLGKQRRRGAETDQHSQYQ
jgi:hypothetical protein